jgi:hypothetical protein
MAAFSEADFSARCGERRNRPGACRSRSTWGAAATCALRTHPHRAVSPLAVNRLLVILAERLLFDLDSLHNAALGGDRQIPPISIQEETLVLVYDLQC